MSGERYRVLILPAMQAARLSTLEAARTFVRSGGLVIACGCLPGATERGSEDPLMVELLTDIFQTEPKPSGGRGVLVSHSTAEVFRLINELVPRDVTSSVTPLHVLHRRLGENDVFYFFNPSAVPQAVKVEVRAQGQAEQWDAWTGVARPIPTVLTAARTSQLELSLEAREARIIVFSQQASPLGVCAQVPFAASELMRFEGAWTFAVKPTMDNQFGDFRLPGVRELLGPEQRRLTGGHFERWAAQAHSFPPCRQAVLASFPRSGTTLIEQVLDSHPQLVSSDEREAFGRDIFPALWRSSSTPLPTAAALDAIPVERLLAQRQRYLTYMAAALDAPIGDRMHLDKNPTLTPLLPGMLRLFPETRLLIALRDPRDVVISCFMQYLPLNPNSVCYLTLERTARRYAFDLGLWLRFREQIRSPWLDVRYEDCVANLERETRRALDFLQLPWDPQVLTYRERLKTKAVASPTYEAVSKPLYTSAIGRWKNYRKYLEPCLAVLEPFVRAFGYEPS